MNEEFVLVETIGRGCSGKLEAFSRFDLVPKDEKIPQFNLTT